MHKVRVLNLSELDIPVQGDAAREEMVLTALQECGYEVTVIPTSELTDWANFQKAYRQVVGIVFALTLNIPTTASVKIKAVTPSLFTCVFFY